MMLRLFVLIKLILFATIVQILPPNQTLAQWPTDPDELLFVYGSINGWDPIPDGNGGAYIVSPLHSWMTEIYIQHLNDGGYFTFPDDYVFFADNQTWLPSWRGYATLASDGCLLYPVHYQDPDNNQTTDYTIVKLSPEGEFVWGRYGIPCPDGAYLYDIDQYPDGRIVPDEQGGCWIFDSLVHPQSDTLRAYHLNAGDQSWEGPFPVIVGVDNAQTLHIVKDGENGLIIAAVKSGFLDPPGQVRINRVLEDGTSVNPAGLVIFESQEGFLLETSGPGQEPWEALFRNSEQSTYVFTPFELPDDFSGSPHRYSAVSFNNQLQTTWNPPYVTIMDSVWDGRRLNMTDDGYLWYTCFDSYGSSYKRQLGCLNPGGQFSYRDTLIVETSYTFFTASSQGSLFHSWKVISDGYGSDFWVEKLNPNGSSDWDYPVHVAHVPESYEPWHTAIGLSSDGHGGVIFDVGYSWYLNEGGIAAKVNNNGTLGGLTVSDLHLSNPPQQFEISVYPNPFNTSVRIEIVVERARDVPMDIVDLQGRRVYSIARHLKSGRNLVSWQPPPALASGIYFLQIENSLPRKLVLVR